MFNNLPERSQEVFDRMATNFQNALTESNPFLRGSYLNSLIKAFSLSLFDWYKALELNLNQLFPNTATGEGSNIWGRIQGVTQQVRSQSSGRASIGGLAGSVVARTAVFNANNGQSYRPTASAQIQARVNSITAISKVGLVVTVDTENEHNLNNNIQVSITGADVAQYNGTFSITVTGLNTFQYTITEDGSLPATTNMNANYTLASIELESVGFGTAANIDANTALSIQTPLPGINTTAYAEVLGFTGGRNDETTERYRERYLDAYKNPRTPLNEADIRFRCFQVQGVTRVWVRPVTPDVGQVTTYFVRDDDANIIPSAGEISQVKTSILQSKPAIIDDANVIVSAPQALPQNFTFSAITPNTPSMQQAISNNLSVFFRNNSNVGQDIQAISYQRVIAGTVDLETGDVLESFTLTTPSGDITVNDNQLATLGVISFG